MDRAAGATPALDFLEAGTCFSPSARTSKHVCRVLPNADRLTACSNVQLYFQQPVAATSQPLPAMKSHFGLMVWLQTLVGKLYTVDAANAGSPARTSVRRTPCVNVQASDATRQACSGLLDLLAGCLSVHVCIEAECAASAGMPAYSPALTLIRPSSQQTTDPSRGYTSLLGCLAASCEARRP